MGVLRGCPAEMISTRAVHHRLTAAIVYGVALAGSAFFLLPIFWMLTTALRPENALFSVPPEMFPHAPAWRNFTTATTIVPFWRYLANSLLYAGLGAIGTVVSSAIVAYPLARLRAPGLNLVLVLVLATMMLPLQVLLVSQFLIFKELGWYGSYLPLIIPSWLGGGPFNIFLLRQFFLTLPREYDQAALIDGAGFWRIFCYIILPQSVPALLAVSMLDFVSKWNDFLGPLIYLNRTDSYPLSLGLSSLRDIHNTQWNYLMADSLLAILPCVLVFFAAQRLLVRGLVVGRPKG